MSDFIGAVVVIAIFGLIFLFTGWKPSWKARERIMLIGGPLSIVFGITMTIASQAYAEAHRLPYFTVQYGAVLAGIYWLWRGTKYRQIRLALENGHPKLSND